MHVLKGNVSDDLLSSQDLAFSGIGVNLRTRIDGPEHNGAALLRLGSIRDEHEDVAGLRRDQEMLGCDGKTKQQEKIVISTHLNRRKDDRIEDRKELLGRVAT